MFLKIYNFQNYLMYIDYETHWCHFGRYKDLWYHCPLCLSAEKNSARDKVTDKLIY